MLRKPCGITIALLTGRHIKLFDFSRDGSVGTGESVPRTGVGFLPPGGGSGADGQYAPKTFSSRAIERATYDSVAFRFIAGNEPPDHDTIATEVQQLLRLTAIAAAKGKIEDTDPR
jgi:hypothetical protein